MIKCYIANNFGLAKNELQFKEISKDIRIGENDVVIKNKYIGINSVDAEIHNSPYRKFPYIPGIQTTGTVINVGSKVEKFKVGDLVFCFSGFKFFKIGGLSEFSVVDELIPIKIYEKAKYITKEIAASSLQIAVGYILINKICKPPKNSAVIIFDPISDINHIVAQLLNHAGNLTIAIVRNQYEYEEAKKCGYSKCIHIDDIDLVKQIRNMTNIVSLALDSISTEKTIKISTSALTRFGTYISYGNLYNKNTLSIPLLELREKSLFATSVNFQDYFKSRFFIEIAGMNIMDAIHTNIVKPNINSIIKFNNIKNSYEQLHNGELPYLNMVEL